VARLIRTEKEVEGRYTEQWVVVEGDDDALDQWPQGPGEVVGRPAPRQDGHQRARGEAIFTADLKLPGLLHTAVLRSPYARARANNIDFSRALELPGVLAAVGPDECHVLQTEPPFHGSPVAAIAAVSYERAREALALVEVEWEELEPLLDPAEAVRRNRLWTSRSYERGDVDAGFAEADVVVEAEYRTQTVLHNAMETHQSVARWEGDTLEIYISTQFIWGIRDSVSEQLGLPPDRVRVVCNYMGGGFGAKNGPGDYTYIAVALAAKTGRPVRCALSRREENLATGNRNGTIQKLRAGARSDGTLVALEAEYVNTIGWSGFSGPTYGPIEMLYACDNVRTQTYGTKLNLPPNAAFRAPGFVEGTFGLECVLDELAARLELDPLELRRQNHADNDLADGRPFSSKKLLECYDRADQHWARREEVRARSEGPVRRGTGLASQIWYGGGGPPSYAWVRVGSDGNAGAHGDAGHRPGTRRRWRRSPPRSSACRSSGCAASSATRRAGRMRRSRPVPRPPPRWGRRYGPRPRTPLGRSSRSRRSVITSKSTCSRSRTARSSPPTVARGRWRK
jgi:xanthine dehydrogenase YagR molybdenum-binding subunit